MNGTEDAAEWGRFTVLGARTRTGFHGWDQQDGDRRTGFNLDQRARLEFTYQENLAKLRFRIGEVDHMRDRVVGTRLLDRSRRTVLWTRIYSSFLRLN